MEVIGLQIFVSLMLVLGSVLLFAWSAKQRDHEHDDRLALLPLENDSSHPLIDSDARGVEKPRAEVAEHGFETE
jgi:nitrogen fixation-related uncharacterized protein